MIYSVPLPVVSLTLGLSLTAAGAAALVFTEPAIRFLRALPRSSGWGNALFLSGAIWFFILIATIDLMEYSPQRSLFLWIIVLGSALVLALAREFLAVRGLGILILLAAQILLDATFLRDEPSRLLITLIAYFAIVLACFWVGAPYLLRDQIAWAIRLPGRLRLLGWSATGLGVILVVMGLFIY